MSAQEIRLQKFFIFITSLGLIHLLTGSLQLLPTFLHLAYPHPPFTFEALKTQLRTLNINLLLGSNDLPFSLHVSF